MLLSFVGFGHVFAYDLMTAYVDAEHNDASYRAATNVLEAMTQRQPQAMAQLFPDVVLSAAAFQQYGDSQFDASRTYYRHAQTWNWALKMSQPLYNPERWLRYEQSGLELYQAVIQYNSARQNLILRVAQGYFDVLLARRNWVVTHAQLVAARQQLATAKRFFETGLANATDAHESQARVDLLEAQLVVLQNNVESKLDALAVMTGQRVSVLLDRAEVRRLPALEPGQADYWTTQAEQHNLSVRMMDLAVQIAEYERTNVFASYQPKLDLVASYAHNYASGQIALPVDTSSQINTGQIGVQFSLPIYSGGILVPKSRELTARKEQRASEWLQAKRLAVMQTREALRGVQQGLIQIERLEAALKSNRQAVVANQTAYRVGTRVNADVLNAEQQLFATERDLAKANYDVVINGLALKAAVGSLDLADLNAVNQLLDAQQPIDFASYH